MAIDPVCGMLVDEKKAAHKHAEAGNTYYFCSAGCKTKFAANPGVYLKAAASESQHHSSIAHGSPQAGVVTSARVAAMPPTASADTDKAKDPICGMVISKAGAVAAGLVTERAGRSYYFCSPACKRTFDDPERELKSMKRRVTIALTGVLARDPAGGRLPRAGRRGDHRDLGADPVAALVHLGRLALHPRNTRAIHRRLEFL